MPGVQYGRFDLHRLINTVCAVSAEGEAPRLGILEGGIHGAEGLVLARYFMFTQVYFHKTRDEGLGLTQKEIVERVSSVKPHFGEARIRARVLSLEHKQLLLSLHLE